MGGVPRTRSALAAFAVVAFVLVACGPPRYHYVKSGKGSAAFFKVPRDWRLFDQDTVLQSQPLTSEQRDRFKAQNWTMAFDGAPTPSLEHVLGPSKHPWGFARSRLLTPQESDGYSLANLRKELLGIDPAAEGSNEENGIELVNGRNFNRDGGLRGNEILVNVHTPTGVLTLHQIALVDAKTSNVQVLVVGCESDCYNANKRVIDAIVDSWTVKER